MSATVDIDSQIRAAVGEPAPAAPPADDSEARAQVHTLLAELSAPVAPPAPVTTAAPDDDDDCEPRPVRAGSFLDHLTRMGSRLVRGPVRPRPDIEDATCR